MNVRIVNLYKMINDNEDLCIKFHSIVQMVNEILFFIKLNNQEFLSP